MYETNTVTWRRQRSKFSGFNTSLCRRSVKCIHEPPRQPKQNIYPDISFSGMFAFVCPFTFRSIGGTTP
jgi:hypothetical protein